MQSCIPAATRALAKASAASCRAGRWPASACSALAFSRLASAVFTFRPVKPTSDLARSISRWALVKALPVSVIFFSRFFFSSGVFFWRSSSAAKRLALTSSSVFAGGTLASTLASVLVAAFNSASAFANCCLAGAWRSRANSNSPTLRLAKAVATSACVAKSLSPLAALAVARASAASWRAAWAAEPSSIKTADSLTLAAAAWALASLALANAAFTSATCDCAAFSATSASAWAFFADSICFGSAAISSLSFFRAPSATVFSFVLSAKVFSCLARASVAFFTASRSLSSAFPLPSTSALWWPTSAFMKASAWAARASDSAASGLPCNDAVTVQLSASQSFAVGPPRVVICLPSARTSSPVTGVPWSISFCTLPSPTPMMSTLLSARPTRMVSPPGKAASAVRLPPGFHRLVTLPGLIAAQIWITPPGCAVASCRSLIQATARASGGEASRVTRSPVEVSQRRTRPSANSTATSSPSGDTASCSAAWPSGPARHSGSRPWESSTCTVPLSPAATTIA